jgi:hypothetical protein
MTRLSRGPSRPTRPEIVGQQGRCYGLSRPQRPRYTRRLPVMAHRRRARPMGRRGSSDSGAGTTATSTRTSAVAVLGMTPVRKGANVGFEMALAGGAAARGGWLSQTPRDTAKATSVTAVTMRLSKSTLLMVLLFILGVHAQPVQLTTVIVNLGPTLLPQVC